MEPETEELRNHNHQEMAETFYVVEREIELIIGDQTVTGRGNCARSEGSRACFSDPGLQSSILLIMFCPADSREKYFVGLAEKTKGGQRPDPHALLELLRKYDAEPVAELVYGGPNTENP